MTKLDPKERPTIEQILNDSYFKKISFDDLNMSCLLGKLPCLQYTLLFKSANLFPILESLNNVESNNEPALSNQLNNRASVLSDINQVIFVEL
jgi:hypothetical protein